VILVRERAKDIRKLAVEEDKEQERTLFGYILRYAEPILNIRRGLGNKEQGWQAQLAHK